MSITQNKRLKCIFIIIAALLLIPLIAMQFTKEVAWDVRDFAVMAVLLMGTGLMCELVLRKVKGTGRRIALCTGILIVLLLVWAELAVGIFGTPFAGS